MKTLAEHSFRARTDLRNEKIGFKIREHTLLKVPYLLVLGDREVENRTVAVRTRSGEDLGVMDVDALINLFTTESARYGRAVLED